MRKGGLLLWYAWRVAVNLFYVAVVWAVLDQVRERPESVLLPVLGILYVTLRTIGIGIAQSHIVLGQMVEAIDRRLRAQEPGYEPEDQETIHERKMEIGRFRIGSMIDIAGLSAISLLCLIYFLVAIGVI